MSTGKILCRSNYFDWTFTDVSTQLDKEGNIIQSPNFDFGGTSWHLQIYPRVQDGDDGWISVYLVKLCDLEICISAQIGLKRDDGIVHVSHQFDEQNFSSESWYNGFEHFVQRSVLRTDMSEIAPEDKVTFFCSISSINKGCKEKKTLTSKLEFKGLDKLSQDLGQLYLNGKYCDMTIQVADQEFQAHRLILGARSPVLASMYSDDSVEDNTGIIEIDDCDPEVFQDFLIFLYSGIMESITWRNVFGLYTAADKYDVEEMKEECQEFMISNLSVESFCDVMAFALEYRESELMSLARDYFVENAKNISETSEWLSFLIDYPEESNKLCIKAFEFYEPY